MKSMTGYGSSEITTNTVKISIEARSENHRFLDLRINIPDTLNGLETQLTDLVKKYVLRGKLRLSVSVIDQKSLAPSFDKDVIKTYFGTLKKFKKELDIRDEIKLDHILAFKELFNGNSKSSYSKATISKIKQATSETLQKLEKSRDSEGKKIQSELRKRISKCEILIKRIKSRRKNFSKDASKKLKERITVLLDDASFDESRLFQEVAYLIERSDITEELVRLDAHTGKFKETLKKKGPVGKELDFLVQEMNREAGTISAKSKDAKISHLVISLRSEFEKLREQIQNVE